MHMKDQPRVGIDTTLQPGKNLGMDINYGDIVEYVNEADQRRLVRVSYVSENLDGMGPGFDGVIQDYDGATDIYRDSDMPFRSVWGLVRQVVRVVRPA